MSVFVLFKLQCQISSMFIQATFWVPSWSLLFTTQSFMFFSWEAFSFLKCQSNFCFTSKISTHHKLPWNTHNSLWSTSSMRHNVVMVPSAKETANSKGNTSYSPLIRRVCHSIECGPEQMLSHCWANTEGKPQHW